jgi:hypothetical protein
MVRTAAQRSSTIKAGELMLDQIDAALSLVDRFQRWRERQKTPVEESVQARFVRLFAAHGVHRNQIPRFFGHGIELADVRDDATLAGRLTAEHLSKASELFCVRLGWLESGLDPAQERLNFYKQPQRFWDWLSDVSTRVQQKHTVLRGLLLLPRGVSSDMEAVLLIAEPIAVFNDEWIERIHWVPAGPPDYWRCRGYLASYVAAADQCNVVLRALRIPNAVLEKKVMEVDLVGSTALDDLHSGCDRVDALKWLEDPKAFLSGVDPEQNNFGLQSALHLWLDLEAQGLMKSASPRPSPRPLFEGALRRFS